MPEYDFNDRLIVRTRWASHRRDSIIARNLWLRQRSTFFGFNGETANIPRRQPIMVGLAVRG
jgi:hypothetical protein